MSVFRPRDLTRRDASTPTFTAAMRAAGLNPRGQGGIRVTTDSAMRLSAFWRSVWLLTDLVATLPAHSYTRPAGGTAVKVPNQPNLLVDPAGDGTGFETWVSQLLVSMLVRGNGFGYITALGPDLFPERIDVVHPDRVAWKPANTAGAGEWFLDRKPIELWPIGPLWHINRYPAPGSPLGLSVIGHAAQTLGLGLEAQRFGTQWFVDGAHPSAVLSTDKDVDSTQAGIIKDRFMAAVHGRREPAVLGRGFKYEAISVKAEESQFLATIKANVADIARFFGVQPEAIGGESGSSMTYTNREQRALDLLTYTIGPLTVRLERALSRLRPAGEYVKINPDGIARVDLITRLRSYDLALRGGWRSRNEIRRLEDEPALPAGEGDEFLWPPYRAFPIADDETKEPAGG